MDDISYILLKFVLTLCVSLVTAFLVPLLKDLRNDKRYSKVIDMVTLAVRAAEQTITDPKSGSLKKSQVTYFIKNWLEKEGITITDDEISELIESAVYSMKETKEAANKE